MTRREEIKQKALSKYPQGTNRYNKFIEGAKWADKTIIEKACEYLKQRLYNTPIFEHDEDETHVNYVCASCCDSVEEFIKNFCRVMEE